MAVYGKFVWYDLATREPDAAKAFYSAVFDWGTQGWDKGDYAMWTIGEKGPFGGLMPGKPGAPSQWLGYISTPDLKATIERALELGGALVVPITAISENSKFAVLSDPQGAQFAVFNSVNEDENDWDTPAPFHWRDLNTTDWTAARDFYVDLFDWQQTDTMSFDGSGSDESTYWMFGPAGSASAADTLGGMSNAAKSMGKAVGWLQYASVDDLDATIERIKANGGQITSGPMSVPSGDRVAQCVDPQGAHFAIHAKG